MWRLGHLKLWRRGPSSQGTPPSSPSSPSCPSCRCCCWCCCSCCCCCSCSCWTRRMRTRRTPKKIQSPLLSAGKNKNPGQFQRAFLLPLRPRPGFFGGSPPPDPLGPALLALVGDGCGEVEGSAAGLFLGETRVGAVGVLPFPLPPLAPAPATRPIRAPTSQTWRKSSTDRILSASWETMST